MERLKNYMNCSKATPSFKGGDRHTLIWTGAVERILLGLNEIDICFSLIEPAVEGYLVFPWYHQGTRHLTSYSAILCWWLLSLTSPHCPK